MRLGKAERYLIDQTPSGLRISTRQTAAAMRLAIIVIAALAWWRSPLNPFGMEWRGTVFFVTLLILITIGAWYRESWLITDHEVVFTNSFRWHERRVPRGRTIRWRRGPSSRENNFRLELLGDDGRATGLRLTFFTPQGVEQLLRVIRPVVSSELIEQG